MLKRIRLETCHLTKREKVQYIAGFLEEPHSECLMTFFNTQKGVTMALKRALISRKRARLLTALILLPMNHGI